jgi:hypothetical protein
MLYAIPENEPRELVLGKVSEERQNSLTRSLDFTSPHFAAASISVTKKTPSRHPLQNF